MERINFPIYLNEVSENVVNLHRALKALGDYVDENEQLEGRAGESTQTYVKELLASLEVPAPVDKTVLIDAAAAEAVNQLLEERGMLDEEPPFKVNGKTLKYTGEAVPDQTLHAYDVDLRGAAVYRTVQKLAELQANGGFEPLALIHSDRKGRYSFTFTPDQAETAERKYADVIVFAVEGDEITGRSHLVKSTEYTDPGEIRDLDVIVEREIVDKTEYESLMTKLNPFLDESAVTLAEPASSPDQVDFIAQELDEEPGKIRAAALAQALCDDALNSREAPLSHELFYGIGRQGIQLDWPSLFRRKNAELNAALDRSAGDNIIAVFPPDEITLFLQNVREIAAQKTLDHIDGTREIAVDGILSCALPERTQREAFMNTLADCDGDYKKFWNELLPQNPVFKENPGLVDGVLFTHRLNLLGTGHQPLIEELQVNRKLTSTQELLELSTAGWNEILDQTGVPENVPGNGDEEKRGNYIAHVQNLLHAAFPTQKTALMATRNELPITDADAAEGIKTFLSNSKDFDIARSRITDFEDEIKTASPLHFEKVKNQLSAVQRVFQVSPTPGAMVKLMENGLDSAHAIAGIPAKSFVKMYGETLGGEQYAHAVHQRASYIKTRSEHIALTMYDMSHGATPRSTMTQGTYGRVMEELEKQVPNYTNLFGSPDICECEHCRSVYSPAAYFVDLLSFLRRGVRNDDNKSPLEMLAKRRPDLLHLPLTCENTHTLIPYIDLVNEVMEYYTAKGALDENAAHDTGDTTAEELRANPQNVNLGAYENLKDAVYPFTLPYHQPLDMIRTYSAHQKTSRYEILKTMQTDFSTQAVRAVEAEALLLSEEEYTILTRENFDEVGDTKDVHEYFGYTAAGDLEQAAEVPEFLKRSGVKYTELVELVKTRFVNPGQTAFDYLDDLFAGSGMDGADIYDKLEQIESGALLPLNDADIMEALDAREITSGEFVQWVQEHLDEFRSVITLYQVESKCELDTTYLRTLGNVYDGIDSSGISTSNDGPWSKIHRFIRLWRKLGWSIHELDLVLYALGETDITPQTVAELASAVMLNKQLKLPLDQLACIWGNIDTYGDKSLYKKLFLNKAVQQIDGAFKADAWGNYLQRELDEDGNPVTLAKHRSTVLAAFRMTAEDLESVLGDETIILERDTEQNVKLNLANLSAIYRYRVLAKALKFSVTDFCLIKQLFIPLMPDPLAAPADTSAFLDLAAEIKKSGFNPAVLQYIFTGSVPAESTFAPDSEKSIQAAQNIHTAFTAVEQEFPEEPGLQPTSEMLNDMLSIAFQPGVVEQLTAILEGTSQFTVITDKNLDVQVTATLAVKYSYTAESGELTCTGFMTPGEKTELETLVGVTTGFIGGVEELYLAPEDFIENNFNGLFAGDMDEAKLNLLNRPGQSPGPTMEEKIQYVYRLVIPMLRNKRREDALVHHTAVLTGLSEAVTAVLIKNDPAQPLDGLSQAVDSDTDFENTYITAAANYHRAAAFISGFELNEREVEHFIGFSANFADIDFHAPQPEHWVRIADYVNLRSGLPQARAALTDVFEESGKTYPDPAAHITALQELLLNASAWDAAAVDYLVNTHFGLAPADFKNETALNKMYHIMRLVSKTGISPGILSEPALHGSDFSGLNNGAQLFKHTVKAKYEDADWPETAGKLSDKIRKNQEQALIQYLLMRPELRQWGVKDADGLFEYFLIDVQMGACMDTSRIVQANSSIQLFVTRCLLNLESVLESGMEKGVSPAFIDTHRWEWMKNYRVWEANRKVFLYPENWLEPEWRDDRSPFFKELESELVQNDITGRSVETAFRNYLSKLDVVSGLDVCGMYRDKETERDHVFGRTHNIPYKYYYRTRDKYRKWSAWEKVELDIRCVDDGDDSGVHLVPVVWKKRLFLFWLEFLEKQEEASGTGNQTVWDLAGEKAGSLKPKKYWEVRLAWSEYVDNQWTPKQLTKEFIKACAGENMPQSIYTCRAAVEQVSKKLVISLSTGINFPRGAFIFSDIQSKMNSLSFPSYQPPTWGNYTNHFMKHKRTSPLHLGNHMYLEKCLTHKLLYSHQLSDFESTLNYPFFYQGANRTYFADPVWIRVTEEFVDPGIYIPLIPELTEPEWFREPGILMPPGSEVYQPDDMFVDAGLENPAVQCGFTNPAPFGNFPESGVVRTMSSQSSNQLMSDSMEVSASFGGTFKKPLLNFRVRKGFEFHTFYHPCSGSYTTRLNQFGMPGLMESDTSIPSDNGDTFTGAYEPNWDRVAPKQADLDKPENRARTFYKENVCFDVYGAYGIYNWELFFHAPLYIAVRLSKNGKFAEAMKWFHYIFDPTTDEMPEPGGEDTARYWKVLPFKTTPVESLQDFFMGLQPGTGNENSIIGEWRDNPFRPHLVARNRPTAYMKNVVIKYVENLTAWGDSLFRRDTMESVNEATQLYVIANHILGPRPEFVPKRGKIKAETYDSLEDKLDDFSNALVQLENLFPYSSEIPAANGAGSGGGSYTGGLPGFGEALYFCIPNNEKLLSHWDTVADRLFKIRHCMNIDGIERSLALFEPPIDPALLIQATAQGLSLSDILSDLGSPPPIYRFSYLIRTAAEFCAEVKSLGSALLAALEKLDGEELGRMRAEHETGMLELMTAVKERQLLEAKANRESLTASRKTAEFRLRHYLDLLGNDGVTVPPEPQLSSNLTAHGPLPADTILPTIEADVDESLVDGGESGVKLISREKEDLDMSLASTISQQVATGLEGIAGVLNLLPDAAVDAKPFGIGTGMTFGGSNFGAAASASAKIPQIISSVLSYQAARASKMAGYIRREQDWTLQANLAAQEIVQLDKQIVGADIRVQSAQKELDNHLKQIKNAEDVEQFLKNKFTNLELYQWMKEQLYDVYKQSYNLAYAMAKKAEKAYRFETGSPTASFIQYGYWDNTYKGLMSGEKLSLALKQLENAYIEENKRELELTKHVSMALLNPLALLDLKETGKCYLAVPEELFDLDFQGHYFRRIKSVSLSIPCVAGPYTTVNCSLRLLKNTIRTDTSLSETGDYERSGDGGDTRFRSSNVAVKAIASSTGQSDDGMFDFNFRDERYLPFEGAGAVSEWEIELTTEPALRQFDYSTISDVIIHMNYTAREDAGIKQKVTDYIKGFLKNTAGTNDQPWVRMFSLNHEFPTEWHRFTASTTGEDLTVFIKKDHFPYLAQGLTVTIAGVKLYSVTGGGLENRTVGGVDLAAFSTEINTGVSSAQDHEPGELSIAAGTNVLTRDKDEQVFLVLSYTLGG